MLHRDKIPDHYNVHVGNRIIIRPPRLPMTRYTQFVSLEPQREGDIANFHIYPMSSPQEEGLVSPQGIEVQCIRPGVLHVNFVAKDILTGEVIPGVEPVGITVEASYR